MKHLLGLLQKSRLFQVVAALLTVCVALAVAYIFMSSRLFSSASSLVIAIVVALLTLRVIQLEWKTATAEKSRKFRRAELDTRFETLNRSLRAEMTRLSDSARVAMPNNVAPVAISSAVAHEPSAGIVIGRTAASVPESTVRQSVLFELLGQGGRGNVLPKIAGVLSPGLRHALDGLYDVTELSPSFAREQIARIGAGMVVIDQKAFESGPWYGADSATGTLLFAELSSTIEAATSAGNPVWFIATDSVPSPYTNEFRKRSTGVFGFESTDLTWTEGLSVRFVNAVDEYVAGEKK